MKGLLGKIKKAWRLLGEYGVKEFGCRLKENFRKKEIPYEKWRRNHIPASEELERQRREQLAWKERPLISLAVSVRHMPEVFVRKMVESVQKQTYTNWQMCIADGSGDEGIQKLVEECQRCGCNIRYCKTEKNTSMVENANAALHLAEGAWIGLLDAGDLLEEHALYETAKMICRNSLTDIIYTDEDRLSSGGTYTDPGFKPDFSPDLLRSNNYITHFFVFRKALLENTGGFLTEYEGAQDYDFILRCTENARKICHIPQILYHWRTHEASTSENPKSKLYAFEAGRRAIEAHLRRQGVEGIVSMRQGEELGFYDVRYPVQGQPLVSILIPNKDQSELLDACIQSIERSTYPYVEIIIIENNSVDSKTFEYYETLEKRRYPVSVITWGGNFNYSAINNFGVSHARGDYLVLLNNDIEIISPDWLEQMLGNCQRPEVGIAGARLYYPDDTIQHAGIVLGMGEGIMSGGVAGSVFVGMHRSRDGYLHKAALQLNYSAVTAACLMVQRSIYEEVGGLEEELAVAFNDVDFCLKVRKAGYLVVYDPHAEAYHYESKSRGAEDTPEKIRRFQGEVDYMKEKWGTLLSDDPYYNRNLSLRSGYKLRTRNRHKQ